MAKKKILLVDSMELALKMEEEILRRAGVEVLTARGGPEALELVRTHLPDLVFLEINMPDMPGDQCCRAIKSDPHLQAIPVLIMLSVPNPQLVDQCFAANCDGVVTKPLQQAAVMEKITELLEIQTRKLTRLDLKIPVTIQYQGQNRTGKSVNLNERGILLKSDEAFTEDQNYLLNFSLGSADGNYRIWSRLERQIPPGEGRNPGPRFLALFRFLSPETRLREQIALQSKMQARKDAEHAAAPQASQSLKEAFETLQKSTDLYQSVILNLAQDLNAQPSEIPEAEAGSLRLIIAGLKPWEKAALRKEDEDSLALIEGIALHGKLLLDLRKLETLPVLSATDQQALKAMQPEYFKTSDRILDKLQERINAQMQNNNLEFMKQLNLSKSETFQRSVSLKSLMNRLANPQAALEASQFQYQEQGEEAYQVTAYDRAAPEEETKKTETYETKTPKKKVDKSKVFIQGITLVILLLLIPAGYFYSRLFLSPSLVGGTVANSNLGITFETPFPVKSSSVSAENVLRIYVSEDWYQTDYLKREGLVNKILVEVGQKGYRSMELYGRQGTMLGYGKAYGDAVLFN